MIFERTYHLVGFLAVLLLSIALGGGLLVIATDAGGAASPAPTEFSKAVDGNPSTTEVLPSAAGFTPPQESIVSEEGTLSGAVVPRACHGYCGSVPPGYSPVGFVDQPGSVAVSELVVRPSRISAPGEPIGVSFTVQNTHEEPRSTQLSVTVNGSLKEQFQHSLDPGASESMTISLHTADLSHGESYTVTVLTVDDQQSSSFVIQPGAPSNGNSDNVDTRIQIVDDDGPGFTSVILLGGIVMISFIGAARIVRR